jgi:GTP-binding protein Era
MTDASGATERPSASNTTQCGYVALLGAPNVGKSTLFNTLLGTRLSIVTPKAQTTQRQIVGLNTTGEIQLVVGDAPGIFKPSDLLQRSLLAGAVEAARSADVRVLVLDPTSPMDTDARGLLFEVFSHGVGPALGVVNKADVAETRSVDLERQWLEEAAKGQTFVISAHEERGTDELLEALRALVPPSINLQQAGH